MIVNVCVFKLTLFNPFVVPNHIAPFSINIGFVCFELNLEEDIEKGSKGSNEYILLFLFFLLNTKIPLWLVVTYMKSSSLKKCIGFVFVGNLKILSVDVS